MSYQSEVIQNFFHLKLDEWCPTDRHTDVIIETELGSFRYYRVLLAAASDYFDHLFDGNPAEDSQEVIVAPSDCIDAAELQKMICVPRTGDIADTIVFYLKLNKWRITGRYTDVDIKVEGQTFHCHRIVLAAGCDYFETLFGCHFPESSSKTVCLPDDFVSAEAFEQILKFLYAGDINITSSNAFDLLSACEFLRANIVDNVCVRFIERNLPVHNMFSVLMHAWACEKSSLVYNLATYMSEHLEEFSKTKEFLELNFDIMRRIVDLYPSLDEVPLMNAIMHWVNYRHEERSQYFDTLTDLVKFEDEWSSTAVDRKCRHRQVVLENKSLYVDMFINYASYNTVRASISNSLQYSVSCEKTSCRPMRARCVVSMNSHLYFLDYCCTNHGYTFYSCTSTDESTKKNLNYPVSESHDYRICGLQNMNCIYLYDRYLFLDSVFNSIEEVRNVSWPAWFLDRSRRSNARASGTNSSMVPEERKTHNALHSYNCETNEWYPMTTMKRQLMVSSMATCDVTNTLYLIGGMNARDSSDQSSAAGYAQAYDHRVRTWRELPRTKYEYKDAACVAFNGKLYVYEEMKRKCEVYDPSAGKWYLTEANPHMTSFPHHRMVPFRNHLWLFNNCYKEKYAHSVHLYSPTFDKWKHSWTLKDALRNDRRISQSPEIMDAFVF